MIHCIKDFWKEKTSDNTTCVLDMTTSSALENSFARGRGHNNMYGPRLA